MNDIKFMIGDTSFNARAASVIIKNNKVLMQKKMGDKYLALPGGKIEAFEKGSETVVRELAEETGETNAEVIRPLWFVEYICMYEGHKHHQYILGYLLNIPDDSILLKSDKFMGIETNKKLCYEWVELNNLLNTPIKPDFLYDKLLNIKDEYEYIYEDHN